MWNASKAFVSARAWFSSPFAAAVKKAAGTRPAAGAFQPMTTLQSAGEGPQASSVFHLLYKGGVLWLI